MPLHKKGLKFILM